jgi:hypothetical protein
MSALLVALLVALPVNALLAALPVDALPVALAVDALADDPLPVNALPSVHSP